MACEALTRSLLSLLTAVMAAKRRPLVRREDSKKAELLVSSRHLQTPYAYTAESLFQVTPEARTQSKTTTLQRSLTNVLQQELLGLKCLQLSIE